MSTTNTARYWRHWAEFCRQKSESAQQAETARQFAALAARYEKNAIAAEAVPAVDAAA